MLAIWLLWLTGNYTKALIIIRRQCHSRDRLPRLRTGQGQDQAVQTVHHRHDQAGLCGRAEGHQGKIWMIALWLDIFSRNSDLTTSIVLQGCGYVKSRVWLCAKRCGYVWPKPQRCGYVQKGVVMCDQNLNTPLRSQTENGVAGVVMCKMVWLCVIYKSNQTEHHKAS